MPESYVPSAQRREQMLQLLAQVQRLAIQLKRGPASGGDQKLPAAARDVLRLLDRHGPLNVPTLARTRGSSRQNLQIIINRLRQAGLVEFLTNPAHKKSPLVSIAHSGRALLETTAGREERDLDLLVASISERECTLSLDLLKRLRRALERQPGAAAEEILPRKQPAAKPAKEPVESTAEELPVNLL